MNSFFALVFGKFSQQARLLIAGKWLVVLKKMEIPRGHVSIMLRLHSLLWWSYGAFIKKLLEGIKVCIESIMIIKVPRDGSFQGGPEKQLLLAWYLPLIAKWKASEMFDLMSGNFGQFNLSPFGVISWLTTRLENRGWHLITRTCRASKAPTVSARFWNCEINLGTSFLLLSTVG